MKSFPIPVMAVGPGSQPEDEPLNYLAVAEDMAVFRMSGTPEAADPQALAEVRAVLARLIEAMRTLPFGAPRFDLTKLGPAALDLLNQTLGEGEVSVIASAPRRLRIQETAFAGVWRVQYFNSMDKLILDTIEVVDVPEAALAAREDYEDSIGRLTQWLETLEAE